MTSLVSSHVFFFSLLTSFNLLASKGERLLLKDRPLECLTNSRLVDHNARSQGNDWYRIMGKQNSIKQGMTLHNVSAALLCGDTYGGVLMAEHPLVEEGLVELTVCYRTCFKQHCTCHHKETIYVLNCITHFIYWLPPTSSKEIFCTERINLGEKKLSTSAVECSQHEVFQHIPNKMDELYQKLLDRQEGWFRFAAGSGLELATTCLEDVDYALRCGTTFKGWMTGSQPTISDGRVKRQVCFSYAHSCSCSFHATIYVRNCDSFFVYRIKRPPFENSGYCGVPKVYSLKTASSNKTKSVANVDKDICDSYQLRYDPDRLWSSISPNAENCDADLYGRFRFGSKYTPWNIKEGCDKSDMTILTHRCGTRFQGFMEGRHPSYREKYVERIICFQEPSSPCECSFTTIVGVQNCGGFFVYELRGVPRCHGRFCMEANMTSSIIIDPESPPVYGIPHSNGGHVIDKTKKQLQNDNMSSIIGIKALSILLLVVLLVLLLLLLSMILFIWYTKKGKKRSHDDDEEEDLSRVYEDTFEKNISSNNLPHTTASGRDVESDQSNAGGLDDGGLGEEGDSDNNGNSDSPKHSSPREKNDVMPSIPSLLPSNFDESNLTGSTEVIASAPLPSIPSLLPSNFDESNPRGSTEVIASAPLPSIPSLLPPNTTSDEPNVRDSTEVVASAPIANDDSVVVASAPIVNDEDVEEEQTVNYVKNETEDDGEDNTKQAEEMV